VSAIDQLLRFDPAHFWVQHNEHRIIFPEIFFALDYRWFQGTQAFPIAANVVFRLTQIILLILVLWRTPEIPKPFRLGAAAIVAILMGSVIQIEALDSPFLLVWHLSDLAATASLLLLWLAAPPQSGRCWFGFSLATAVIATYSSGNGMLVWPILLCLAICVRFPHRQLIAIGVTGAVSIGAYFIHYSWMSQGSLAKLLSHPFFAAWFVGLYLGAPISYFYRTAGGVAGLAGVVLIAVCLVRAFRRGWSNTPVFFVAIGHGMYVISSALLAAAARMDPGDSIVAAATASRYVSTPLGHWAFLTLLLLWAVARRKGRSALGGHIALGLLTVVILLVVMRYQSLPEKTFAGLQATYHEAGLSMLAGVRDPAMSRVVFPFWPERDMRRPDPDWITIFAPLLQEKGFSIYASGKDLLLGESMNAVFGVPARGQCAGGIFSTSLVQDGVRIGGWAYDLVQRRPPKWIVLATTSGSIIGLGQTWHSGYPSNDDVYHGPSENQWVAFTGRAGLDQQIQAYALMEDDRVACPVGEPVSSPAGRWGQPEALGDRIPVSEWHAEPAWTVNGFHPSVGFLSSGTAYGSWSGSDANQGKIFSAPIPLAGHVCLAVPIAHGPSIDGQSVYLQDADTNRPLVYAPLEQKAGAWRYWAVPLNWPDTKQIRIAALDNGSAWGQWVAVGQPSWCK
jgi:hypothetical protein